MREEKLSTRRGLIGRHCRGGENDYKGGDQLDDKGMWHDKGRVRALALAEIAPQDACHAAPCLPLVHHPLCKYVVQEPYESLKGRFEQLPCMDACAAVPCVRARQSREIAVCFALRCSGQGVGSDCLLFNRQRLSRLLTETSARAAQSWRARCIVSGGGEREGWIEGE